MNIRRTAGFLVFPGWIFLLVACSEPLSLEQEIISNIRNMEAHIEERERRAFMEYVSDDFRGQGGEFNKDRFNGLVLYYLRRYQQVHAQLLPITVQAIGDDEAQATFQVLLTGGTGWLPERGQLYTVITLWRLDGEQWLLQTADWQSAAESSN